MFSRVSIAFNLNKHTINQNHMRGISMPLEIFMLVLLMHQRKKNAPTFPKKRKWETGTPGLCDIGKGWPHYKNMAIPG
jgi:hypothetical protein